MFDDDAPVLKEIQIRCRRPIDSDSVDVDEYIVSISGIAICDELIHGNSIVSNEAAKEFGWLFTKWGDLKRIAEIVEGELTIPYDGIVTLDLKLFVLRRPKR